jgi:hypothetical protein
VFDNKVLRRIFGPRTVKVMGGWGKLYNEELLDLYYANIICTTNIIRIIKSKWIRWAGHIAQIWGRRGT